MIDNQYLVARIGRRNPSVCGLKLYATRSGMWTLDKDKARYFGTRQEASEYIEYCVSTTLEPWVERAP
jgi:hypothetical protein